MKKLTAGIFASLLTVVGGGAAHAKIASTEYVGAYVQREIASKQDVSKMNKTTLNKNSTDTYPSEKTVADAITSEIGDAIEGQGVIKGAVDKAIKDALEAEGIDEAINTAVSNATDGMLKAENIKQGNNVTVTQEDGGVKISATDTTYSAGNGMELSGTTFTVKAGEGINVTDSGVAIKFSELGENQNFQAAISGALNSDQEDLQQAVDGAVAKAITEGSSTAEALQDYVKNTDLNSYVQKTDYASSIAAGIVKAGSGLTAADDGTLSVNTGTVGAFETGFVTGGEVHQKIEQSLGAVETQLEGYVKTDDYATAEKAGIVKQGSNVTIDSDGTLNVNLDNYATTESVTTAVAGVKVSAGNGITVNADGKEVSVKPKENGNITVTADGVDVKDGVFVTKPTGECSGGNCVPKWNGSAWEWETIATGLEGN